MPELTINAEDIAAALARNVSEFTTGTEAEQVAASPRSVTASHGSLACPGPPSTNCSSSRTDVGLALNLDEESIARSSSAR